MFTQSKSKDKFLPWHIKHLTGPDSEVEPGLVASAPVRPQQELLQPAEDPVGRQLVPARHRRVPVAASLTVIPEFRLLIKYT